MKKKYLVIGNPIDHSLSPKLHNYWIKKNNLQASYEKRLLEKHEIQKLILDLKNDLKTGTDTDLINWKFITIEEDKLVGLFNSLKTNLSLDSNAGTPYVFIIDRDSNLRGRDDDDGVKYGYDSRSVADINNNMLDDVKVILAEYRMALKKNNRYKESLD